MKIAVWHNLPSGGGMRALHEHVRGLVALGHNVEVWCPPMADQTFLPLSPFAKVHVIPLDWPIRETLSDHWQITLPIDRKIRAMRKHCEQCVTEMVAGGHDIIFANTCQLFHSPPIARFSKIPTLLYLQEPYRALYEALPTLPWMSLPGGVVRLQKPRTWRKAFSDLRRIRNLRAQVREEHENAKAFDRILVNSLYSRESVLRCYGINSSVCYLGVDTNRLKHIDSTNHGYIVGLGSITRPKNVTFVIESVAALSGPKPKIIWIGNFADKSYIEESKGRASTLGIEIEFRIRIPDEEVVEILNGGLALLYAPILEPFGLAPIEANACGLPVIAVAEGGVRESIQDGVNGLLVNRDPTSAAQAIERLRSDPALHARLRAGGLRVTREQWPTETATNRLVTHMEALVTDFSPKNRQALPS